MLVSLDWLTLLRGLLTLAVLRCRKHPILNKGFQFRWRQRISHIKDISFWSHARSYWRMFVGCVLEASHLGIWTTPNWYRCGLLILLSTKWPGLTRNVRAFVLLCNPIVKIQPINCSTVCARMVVRVLILGHDFPGLSKSIGHILLLLFQIFSLLLVQMRHQLLSSIILTIDACCIRQTISISQWNWHIVVKRSRSHMISVRQCTYSTFVVISNVGALWCKFDQILCSPCIIILPIILSSYLLILHLLVW